MSNMENVATKDDVRSTVKLLLNDIRLYKRDVIKWMFILWLAQIGATLAIVILLSGK